MTPAEGMTAEEVLKDLWKVVDYTRGDHMTSQELHAAADNAIRLIQS